MPNLGRLLLFRKSLVYGTDLLFHVDSLVPTLWVAIEAIQGGLLSASLFLVSHAFARYRIKYVSPLACEALEVLGDIDC